MEHVASVGEMRNENKIFIQKPEGIRPLERIMIGTSGGLF
jgi:hypothetical protein